MLGLSPAFHSVTSRERGLGARLGEPERDMMVSVLLSDSVSPKRIDLKTL